MSCLPDRLGRIVLIVFMRLWSHATSGAPWKSSFFLQTGFPFEWIKYDQMEYRTLKQLGLRSCDKSGQITVIPELYKWIWGDSRFLKPPFVLGETAGREILYLHRLIDRLWELPGFSFHPFWSCMAPFGVRLIDIHRTWIIREGTFAPENRSLEKTRFVFAKPTFFEG